LLTNARICIGQNSSCRRDFNNIGSAFYGFAHGAPAISGSIANRRTMHTVENIFCETMRIAVAARDGNRVPGGANMRPRNDTSIDGAF